MMAIITNNKTCTLVILFALLTLASACKPSAEKLLTEGNELFEEEAYLEALATYQRAQFEDPELAEPYYNAANTLYREGAYPEALTMIQEALKFARQDEIAESSLYNMGNSTYNIQEFDSAVEAYKQALLVNPDDADAKYNLELALQQQEQQEQEQQQEQQQEQEQQDQNQDEGQGQEQEQQNQNQDQGGQENQPQEPGDDSEKGQDEQGDEQDQSQDGQDMNQEDSGDQQEGQGHSQGGDQQEQEQPSQMPPPGQRMTAEQARQLLAAIAQESETLQERLGQIFVAPPLPPVQDW